MNKHLMHILLALQVVPPAAFALSSKQADFKAPQENTAEVQHVTSHGDLKKAIIDKKKTKSNRLNEKESRLQDKPISKQLAKSTAIKRQRLQTPSITNEENEEEEGSEE